MILYCHCGLDSYQDVASLCVTIFNGFFFFLLVPVTAIF